MLGHALSLSPGQETWIRKLKWGELPKFNQLKWKPLHSDPKSSETSAFVKSHKNLAFYWILRAGHMVRVSICSGFVALGVEGATCSGLIDARGLVVRQGLY